MSVICNRGAPGFMGALLAVLLGAGTSFAQPYARFAVPDSARVPAIHAAGAEYEAAWNALLVSWLRADLARADSTRRLAQLAQDVAHDEPAALGTRIAPDALELARRWDRKLKALRVQAAVAESLGLAARNARAFDRADSLYRAALADYAALHERRRAAWVLGSRGANLLVAGRYAEAAAAYEPALAARRALGDSILIGNTLNDLGQTYWQLSRFQDAARALREACAIRAAQRRAGPLGASLNYLGLAQASLGQRDTAMASFSRALELTSAAGDSARTLTVLTNFAGVLIDDGAFDEAQRVSARALAIAQQQGASGAAADLENNLGNLERIAGRYGPAVEHFDRAIAGFEAAGDPERLALALSRRGLSSLALGDPEGARPSLDRAAALADSLADPRTQAPVLSALAMAAQDLGDPTRAATLARRGFDAAIAAGDSTGIHDGAALLAWLAREGGRDDEAARWSERAIAANAGMRAEVRANDLHALGVALQRRGRLDEAEARQQESLAIAEDHGAANEALQALTNLGDIAERRGDDAAARGWYARAAAIADTLRTQQGGERSSISLFASRQFVFEAMIHLLGRLDRAQPDSGWGAEAFRWAERARARAFLDVAGPVRGAAAPVLGIADARALLRGPHAVLLEYSVGDSSTTLWVVRADRWRRLTLPARAALKPRVEAFRAGLADPAQSASPPTLRASRALYRMLIAPAESLLAGADELIVEPDGPLARVPFEALLARDPDAAGAAPRGAWLVDRFAVSYTPSASVLATRTARGGDSLLVAVGAPSFGPVPVRAPSAPDRAAAPLDSLPGAGPEIAAVIACAGGRRVVTLTGAAANRQALLVLPELSRAQVIHVATHGDVNEAEPERSGLWLAPDEPGGAPSRLEVQDIARLRLTAGLVTLSACETGLGRLAGGEGVLGLSRAFLAAGTQSVLASLWPVNDRSTATLMARFYDRALVRRVTRAAALADAKRALLADPRTRAPFFWAPFVLVGSAGTL